jgi:LemA protein
MTISLILLIIILVFLTFIIVTYNKGIKLRNYVKEAFSTMDVYMKKRWDLIPNLVEIVKGYAKHEKGVLEQITKLRNSEYSTMSTNQKLQTNSELAQVLTKFMAVAENYPNLKADQHFLQLSRELSSIETDIANSRKYYNGTVRLLNNFLEMFPTNIVGFIFGIQKEKMFDISDTERQNIEVNVNE